MIVGCTVLFVRICMAVSVIFLRCLMGMLEEGKCRMKAA